MDLLAQVLSRTCRTIIKSEQTSEGRISHVLFKVSRFSSANSGVHPQFLSCCILLLIRPFQNLYYNSNESQVVQTVLYLPNLAHLYDTISSCLTMPLRIGVIYSLPAALNCGLSPRCAERGFGVDMARVVCETLRLSCSFHWFNGTEFGDAFDNGTGTGLIGAIQRGEYDTSVPVFTPTYRRFKAVTFSSLFDVRDIYLMTRAPPATSQELNWKIILVFQWPIWAAYFLLLTVTTIATLWVLQNEQPKKSSHQDLKNIVELGLSLVVNELRQSLFKFHSIRFIFSVWTLGAVVFATAYTSVLFSQTVIAKRKLPFTNFETFVACLERKECRIITHTKSLSSLQQLVAPGSSLGSRIDAALVQNPIIVAPILEIPRAILKEKKQFLVTVRPINDLMYQTAGNRNCKYYLLDLKLSEVNAFPLAKNSSLLRPFNKLASSFREQGLDKAIFNMYSSKSVCDEQWLKGRPSKSWSEKGYMLSSMSTTMLFYGLGSGAGFAIFIAEWLVGNVKRRSVQRMTSIDIDAHFMY